MTIICATFTLGTYSGSNRTDFVTQLLYILPLVISQNMKKKHTSTLAMTEFVKKYIQIEMT